MGRAKKRSEVPKSVRSRCSLEELCELEQAIEKRKIERVREKIHGEEESSE